MRKLIIVLIEVYLVAGSFAMYEYVKSTNKQEVIEFLPQGAIVGYENFKGYKVPLLADGTGGQVRWMADVPWADLPIEMRMKFAATGGGLLSVDDLLEMWEKFGEWKKTGEGQYIGITVHNEGE